MTTPDTPEPEALYERFTVTYPASGTVFPSFHRGGGTFREVQVSHALVQIEAVADWRVGLSRDISIA